VHSNNPPTPPDTLSGTVHAEDTDGLDAWSNPPSSAVAGEDGGFDQAFTSTFRFLIGPGKTPNTVLPIQIRARDIAGFQVIRDTTVLVVP